MAVDRSSASPSLSLPPFRSTYCPHDGAREIRMYMPYADANAVRLRLRLVVAADPRWRHVSAIYEIPNGWAWTLCNECPAEEAAGTVEP
jgi:hypothetical protein